MTETVDPHRSTKPSRNWWKIAFFGALVALELAREIIVLSGAEGARPNSSAMVFGWDGYAQAEGSWKRIDGGGALLPGTVTIECRRETGQCIEASTMIIDKSVFAPDLDRFDASFTPELVTYENDRADCALYSVRIDLKLKKAFAVRERVKNPSNENCDKLEPRIEMQLADGFDVNASRNSLDEHFVPLVKIISAVF